SLSGLRRTDGTDRPVPTVEADGFLGLARQLMNLAGRSIITVLIASPPARPSPPSTSACDGIRLSVGLPLPTLGRRSPKSSGSAWPRFTGGAAPPRRRRK